jgi:hypothetical protein
MTEPLVATELEEAYQIHFRSNDVPFIRQYLER